MIRFRLFGIPIQIEPFFWLPLAFFGGALTASTPERFLNMCLFMIAGATSILVHELGHALTGRAFGAPTTITLQAFGGYASFPAGSFTRLQDFLVTAAGPIVQIILGIIAWAVLTYTQLPTPAATHFVFSTMLVSFVWAILNLIPVIPLDGGRLMLSLFGPRRQLLSFNISFVVAILAGLAMLTTGSILFPVFMASFAFENWKVIQQLRGR